MKKFALGMATLLMLIATACSRSGDADILTTIPANTGYFAVADLRQIIEKLGNEVQEDGDVKIGTQISTLLSSMGARGEEIRQMLTDNQAAIDFSQPVASFEYKGSQIFTFYVSDPSKFRELGDKKGRAFTEKDGIWTDGHCFFMADKQVWATDGGSTFTPQTVSYLCRLQEKESMAGVEYTESLIQEGGDIYGWIDVAKMTSSIFSDNMMAGLAASTLFDGAKYLPFHINFQEGNATLKITVLNSRFQPAPYLLKSSGIDSGMVEEYKGKGDVFMAVAIDPTQIRQISTQFGPMLGAGLTPFINLLANIEGTIVASADSSSKDTSFGVQADLASQEAAVRAADDVMALVPPTDGAVELTGNRLFVHTHTLDGEEIGPYAADMKGAQWAFVMSGSKLKETHGLITKVVVKGVGDGESLQIDMNVYTKPGQNSLKSILEAVAR